MVVRLEFTSTDVLLVMVYSAENDHRRKCEWKCRQSSIKSTVLRHTTIAIVPSAALSDYAKLQFRPKVPQQHRISEQLKINRKIEF